MAGNVDFLDTITLEALENDPYPIWQQLRKHSPVAFVPAIGAWCVANYDFCHVVGSGQMGFIGAKDHPTLTRVFGVPNILSAEGETHQQIRKGVDPSLQPKQVNEMVETVVRPIARKYLASIAPRGGGELMSEYFEPVSVEALRHVMGLDDIVNAETLRRWFHDLNVGASNFALSEELYATSDNAAKEIEEIVGPKLEFLVRHPDESMLSHMLWAGRQREEGPRPFEFIWPSLKVILLGGMQEPGHAAGSTLLGLFSNPAQWSKLLQEPNTWIPYAINEGLRWIAPIGVVERQASRDVELDGNLIEAGSIVQVILASANRDESRYQDPDLFDMERTGETHQAFGNGGHFCAGHFFARQVERIMLEELVQHLPKLRKDPAAPPKIDGWVFRAPKVFRCLWEPVEVEQISTTKDEYVPLFFPDKAAETLELQVRSISLAAQGILAVDLAHPNDKPLPAWKPGAHVDIWLARDRAAQYSLCSDPDKTERWTIVVKLEPESRGISRYIHEELRPGDIVSVGFPRNHFSMVDANGYCFIAGGIGITPLLPMMEAARAKKREMSVTYCGRNRKTMAFLDRVEKIAGKEAVNCRNLDGRADLELVVREAAQAGHVIYVCGPSGMMTEVETYGAKYGATVYCEHFEGGEAFRSNNTGFKVKLAKSGKLFEVPADKSLLQVLEENGYHIRRSCKEGNCGTCETAVLEGKIDHRDVLLNGRQKEGMDRMMVCVSRAEIGEETIVLDL